MKSWLLTFGLAFVTGMALGQSTFYQLNINDLDNNQIALSNFTGEKILITECSMASPDLRKLKFLDSLYMNNPNTLDIIVVPTEDFDTTFGRIDLKKLLIDSLHFHFIVSAPGYGTKAKAGKQLPLMKWLTNAVNNRHFDNDLLSVNQTFVISETGVLFAEMMGPADLYIKITAILKAKAPDS